MNKEMNHIDGNEEKPDCTYSSTEEIPSADDSSEAGSAADDKLETGSAADDRPETGSVVENKSETGSAADDAPDDMQDAPCPACSARRKERSEKEYRDLMNRLNRVEGQIRGIKKMLEKDAYCTDIITQVMAANAALNSFNRVLLSEHIRTCVSDDIKADKTESVDELIFILSKLMK